MKFFWGIIHFAVTIFASHIVSAACTNISGEAGELRWVPAQGKVMWCNGTNWVDPSNGSLFTCGPTDTAGALAYQGGVLAFCDGTNWISMKGSASGLPIGTNPAGSFFYSSSTNNYVYSDGVTLWNMIQQLFCSFNGNTLIDGQSVTAYQNANVPFGGSCASQTRTCTNGSLSGAWTNSSCSIAPPATCTFNGTTLNHNQSVTAYQSAIVPFGLSCIPETRTCYNGTLSGSYTNAFCAAAAPINCNFNGNTVLHGGSVSAYFASTVPYGNSCSSETRTCVNGTLSGSFSHSSCSVSAGSSCSFNGNTILSGQSTTAYQSSTVPFGNSCIAETRTCNNGTLSGSYSNSTCTVAAPANCSLGGTPVNHGASITAFQTATVPYLSSCISESRNCINGTLSGSYLNSSCSVSGPASCTFNGSIVQSGQNITAYSTSMVPYGSSCSSVSQSRACNNGSLSGSYTNASCSVAEPSNCTFNGNTILNGSSVTAYKTSSVPYSTGSCASETRTCNNGLLSGTNTYSSCSVLPPSNCSLNGNTVLHGSNITAYLQASVAPGNTCSSQIRSCNDGTLSGSYLNSACYIQNCVPNSTASCFIANGTGSQTCNTSGTGYQGCSVVSCNYGYIVSGNACIPGSCNNGANNYPSCNTCPGGYFYGNGICSPQVCTPNSTSTCFVANGSGQQSCYYNGSGYGPCSATSCNLGYMLSGGACVFAPDTIPTTTCDRYTIGQGGSVTCMASTTGGTTSTINWMVYYEDGSSAPANHCAGAMSCLWTNVGTGRYVVRANVTGGNGKTFYSDAVVNAVPPVQMTFPSTVDMEGHRNGPWPFSTFTSGSGSVNATNLHFYFGATGGAPSRGIGSYSWSAIRMGGNGGYSYSMSGSQFIVNGDNRGRTDTYVVTVTDGVTSASITLYVGLYW